MTQRKVHIKSFGCQMNKLDSSLVTAALKDAGFDITDKPTDADAILINTCSVRAHAEDRVFSHLGHLKHLKKTHPDTVVAVMGCMAQRLGPQLLAHPAVDIVAGPAQIPQIPDMLAAALENRTNRNSIAVTAHIRTTAPPSEAHALDSFEMEYDSDADYIKSQAFVRVMRGCNNFCTYCIVPYVRGPEVSRRPQEIVEQVKKLAHSGIKQITLLGQTVNSYTYPAGDRTYTLADLLEMTAQIEGVHWIRFITSHPVGFDDSTLRAMADIPKVCPYLHIPAQSGSDTILKSMNRGYSAKQYLDLLDRARHIVGDIAIAGDFIVGFPGETDEDFAATVDLIQKARYKNIFVFKYSPRPGTRADIKLADTIPLETKQQRNMRLLEIQDAVAARDNERFIGKTLEVLVEGTSKKPHLNAAENDNHPQLIARTATDYIVVFNAPESLTGQFTNVTITKTSPLTLFAQPAPKQGDY